MLMSERKKKTTFDFFCLHNKKDYPSKQFKNDKSQKISHSFIIFSVPQFKIKNKRLPIA